MSQKTLVFWISAAGIVGVLFGIFYTFFGLVGFPAYNLLIPKDVIIPWSDGLYGAVFIGFSTLLFFIGRHALLMGDKELMKMLLYGIYTWLLVEALVSLYYAVYFNVAVDIFLAIFLGYPLMSAMKFKNVKKHTNRH